MKSIKLSKAMTSGQVWIRTGRSVVGQVLLKFRSPEVRDRLVSPYPLHDNNRDESYINLSKQYSEDQLKNSNLEDLILKGELELKPVA